MMYLTRKTPVRAAGMHEREIASSLDADHVDDCESDSSTKWLLLLLGYWFLVLFVFPVGLIWWRHCQRRGRRCCCCNPKGGRAPDSEMAGEMLLTFRRHEIDIGGSE